MIFNHLPFAAFPVLYLDPGSGSFIIQLLLGIALGASVAIKIYWRKIRSLFTGKKVEPVQPIEKIDEE